MHGYAVYSITKGVKSDTFGVEAYEWMIISLDKLLGLNED
jgi:hypothetical protein